MPGTPMPFVKIQFPDDDGAPAAGYKLFTYVAGTTTKQNTYTDSALTTPNTNPIVLDAAGRAVIFLDALSYKFVLAPPADTDPPASPIWTADNVSSVPFYHLDTSPLPNGLAVNGSVPKLTTDDNAAILTIPYYPVVLNSAYWLETDISSTSVTIHANTLKTNGDSLIVEWEVSYGSATLSARAQVFGTNVDLGTGGATTFTRARYVISRVDANNVYVSQTVIQSSAVASAAATIGSLNLATTDYAIAVGMASGTFTVRGARIWYVPGIGQYPA